MSSLSEKKAKRAELLRWCVDADSVLETQAPATCFDVDDTAIPRLAVSQGQPYSHPLARYEVESVKSVILTFRVPTCLWSNDAQAEPPVEAEEVVAA